MGRAFAKVMFSAAAKRYQERYGSAESYERVARQGPAGDSLGPMEREFIGRRDSFYIATMTADGWPYVQHRGGPKGFLRVLDDRTLAFADFAGNAQYITVGDLETNDRVALFLMDYPNQARLKVIGHAKAVAGRRGAGRQGSGDHHRRSAPPIRTSTHPSPTRHPERSCSQSEQRSRRTCHPCNGDTNFCAFQPRNRTRP